MPLVRVWYNRDTFHEVDNLRIACMELVPAGLHTVQGQLTPGSIEFFTKVSEPGDRLTVDVFIDIEAMYYNDRDQAEARSEAIKNALNGLFPNITFAIWLKLVNAGWASDVHDPDSNVDDMSIKAAVERTRFLLTEIRSTL